MYRRVFNVFYYYYFYLVIYSILEYVLNTNVPYIEIILLFFFYTLYENY